MAPPRSANFSKRKSAFLSKPKVLYIGDSLAHNAQFRIIEIATNCRIRTVKAYSSVHDTKARWPGKNFTDVTSASLRKSHQKDKFSQLILSAPTVDITNLETNKMTIHENTLKLQQSVVTSCKNMVAVAESAIRNHPELEKVVILEHPPRFDLPEIDPLGLKPQLAKFANLTFGQLWLSSSLKGKIIIGSHNLNCTTDEQFAQRYRDGRSKKYDGVHLYGSHGKLAYTENLIHILKNVQPSKLPNQTFPVNGESKHSGCPQDKYQKTQNKTTNTDRLYSNIYTVPVNNKFDVLGN